MNHSYQRINVTEKRLFLRTKFLTLHETHNILQVYMLNFLAVKGYPFIKGEVSVGPGAAAVALRLAIGALSVEAVNKALSAGGLFDVLQTLESILKQET